MNCYYSNLIEGHDTHPIDIERALQGRLQQGREKARSPARSQGAYRRPAMDRRRRPQGPRGHRGRHPRDSPALLRALPEDLLWVENPDTKEKIRSSPANCATAMSRSAAISPSARPPSRASSKRFEEVYGRLGKTETILAAAAAHHRLAWIHPFLDGNGRVARLMSHATLLEALDTGAVWSVARGLARNVDGL